MKNASVDATVAKAVLRNFKFLHKKNLSDFCVLEKFLKDCRLEVLWMCVCECLKVAMYAHLCCQY